MGNLHHIPTRYRVYFLVLLYIYFLPIQKEKLDLSLIMKYIIRKLQSEDLSAAVNLFIKSYESERESSPLLPPEQDRFKLISDSLKCIINNPSVAIFEDSTLVSFMITKGYFKFKGQKAAMIPEYGHSSIAKDKKKLYQLMYMKMAEYWIRENVHLHLIGHFANDITVKEILFQLGFGAILAERLRDLSPVKVRKPIEINSIDDPADLLEIQIEHNAFYTSSPIFITKSLDLQIIKRDLEEQFSSGLKTLAYRENGEIAAYMIVGESGIDEEGFLLQHSNSAALHSAFIKPHLRGTGIGTALLNGAISLAGEKGYERMMVEHETANYFGGNFWSKYFDPYIYFSMRYIDNSI